MKTEKTTVSAKKKLFQPNKKPSIVRKLSFFIISGKAPPNIPAGQTNLQKYGGAIPNALTANAGSNMTKIARIMYFVKRKTVSVFSGTLIRFAFILCNKSWKKPKGHKKPQIKRPNTAPNSIPIPVT